MACRKVIALPDPLLSRAAEKVGSIDHDALVLASDLTDTMYASPACVGLAAPQIGVSRRAFAADVSGHRKMRGKSCNGLIVMFDPVVSFTGVREVAREGCMSVPDLTCDVERYSHVQVRGVGVDGTELVVEAEGFEARALQHEVDHLDGLLIVDRVAGPHGIFERQVYQ
ncbi:MAG: peptide deformylase [Acidimicrobiales bacterium]